MADTLSPRTTLSDMAARMSDLAPQVGLIETPALAQVVVRTAEPGTVAALGLPPVCALRRTRGRTVIWLGPDEWLLTATDHTGPQLLHDIESRCTGSSYALDVSGQRTRLELTGPHAATILGHGCAIDLSPQAFGSDRAVSTLLAEAGVLLHRLHESSDSTDGFAILVRSSFAHYLAEWLIDAATEYTHTAEDLP